MRNTLHDLLGLSILIVAYVAWAGHGPTVPGPATPVPSPATLAPGDLRILIIQDKEDATGAIRALLANAKTDADLKRAAGQYVRYWDDEATTTDRIYAALLGKAKGVSSADINDAIVAIGDPDVKTIKTYIVDDKAATPNSFATIIKEWLP